ncbi:bacillithiol biosynthesis cysteine-adding enzyme BshC [Sediminibacterium sp.]|uniref:bacillithiol biosynthesis cysteine-adding enzyme BshC n=1 Tax=Sediminibacterium sp. TaxID=1917865 RepID=UPI003F6F14A2
MDCSTHYLPYESTGYFSKIVQDYLQQHENLKSYYLHEANLAGVQSALAERDLHTVNRVVLAEVLTEQYQGIDTDSLVKKNIEALLLPNAYTITTAHQPNIFTGPLYFIYKIIHTIKLASELTSKFPEKKFIPVYYMGSEDADLDELGFVNIDGTKLVWDTTQTGAVGRMKVDKSFLTLIKSIAGQIGVLPYGNELVALFESCYTLGKTIQQATLELVNALFGRYGLVVLVPDHPKLKKIFAPIIAKELTEQFSQKIVAETIASLQENYKVQAAGRPINLFYLIEDKRERIEFNDGVYEVTALGLQFTKETILQELNNYPERFSPNVILRGAFQETILPNIIFIGGGGELAYWLELKNVFKAAEVAYPILMLRNSFALLTNKMVAKQNALQISDEDLFLPTHQLIKEYVERNSANQLSLSEDINNAKAFYETLHVKAQKIDATLNDHVSALETSAIKKIQALELKFRRAEKRKFSTAESQITQLKGFLFPSNSLQERHENLAIFYSKLGPQIIDLIYKSSKGIDPSFILIKLNQ